MINPVLPRFFPNNFTSFQHKNVSFQGINVNKEDAANLKNIKYQCCACCGKPMIEEDEFQSMTRKEFEGNAVNVLKKLQPYSKYMRKTEKTVFNLLKRTSSKYPNEDLNGLLQKRYDYHIKRLEEKQIKIINSAVTQNLKLSDKSRKELEKTMNKIHKILFIEARELPPKRGRVIECIEKLKRRVPEKPEIDKILNRLNELPSSFNDVDAFMIKYAQRSNAEIGQRLISPSRRCLDHIKAKKHNGKDKFPNLVVVCEKCKQGRGDDSYNIVFKTNPKTPKYIRKNLKKVVREIKEGRLSHFDTYPYDVKNTFNEELSEKNKLNFEI